MWRLSFRPGRPARPAGAVRSGGLDPTAWRVIERVATDPDGLARLRAARAHARARVWAAGGHPEVELLIVDADATLVLAHSDAKQGAAGTYKHSFGFAPLLAYLDRGQAPGEPLAGILRPATPLPALPMT